MPDKKPRGPRGPYKKNKTNLLETDTPRGVRLSKEVRRAIDQLCARECVTFNQAVNQGMLWFCRVEAARSHDAPPSAKKTTITVDVAIAHVVNAAREHGRRINPDASSDRSWVYARSGNLGLPKSQLTRELVIAVAQRLHGQSQLPQGEASQ